MIKIRAPMAGGACWGTLRGWQKKYSTASNPALGNVFRNCIVRL
jgi:hypothetical protein